MYRLLVALALTACADDASSEPGVPDPPGSPSTSPPQPARAPSRRGGMVGKKQTGR